ncbi:MAG: hypothetical protein ACJAS1_005338 [Oleiphilaceae bacterium]|jgi:uncharacterized protein YbjT (DUF2867 family)
MTSPTKILVIGSTGYLGLHIIKLLQKSQYQFVALARNKQKLLQVGMNEASIIEAQVTDQNTLVGICKGIDIVISCLGITRQQDGLSYEDVDYQANLNVLLEAEQSGVKRFIYVSAFNAQKYPGVRILKAKEKFATRLLNSTRLFPCVIRPNGFFSDLEEIYYMATKGRVYQFGVDAKYMNPIHGADLAKYCLIAMNNDSRELDIGGPETLTTKRLAQAAFQAQNKPEKIVIIPDIIRRITILIMKILPEKWGGPAEFFLTAMGNDAKAPEYGKHKIADYYAEMFQKEQS